MPAYSTVGAPSTVAPRRRSCSAQAKYWSASPEAALPGGVPLLVLGRGEREGGLGLGYAMCA